MNILENKDDLCWIQANPLLAREGRKSERGKNRDRQRERKSTYREKKMREMRVRETERGERKSVAKERNRDTMKREYLYIYIRVGVFACEKRNKNIKEGKQENNCF